ncbi:MAG: 3-deoxy-D-manno-octulosonic acid transferase [Candidatus Gastranaerophilales bacterium]|nr:3-deoxy-D-manno-octulosonic acid transferase [Candidatus Gastranaerophilales bacterium]
MFLIYEILLPILALVLSPVIIIALIVVPKFRAGFFQKLGFYNKDFKGQNTTVFHAVSVGETNAIADTVKAYKEKYPERKIVITNTTKTGHDIASKIFKDVADEITYFPFDFCFSVNSFFDTYNPEKIVIAETEIWPAFVKEASKKGIHVYIANGRISPHSYEGYMNFSWVFKKVLCLYEKIFMQTKADAQRIRDIGAPDDKVEFMGNLKFDISRNMSDDEQNALRERFHVQYPVLIAASTHEGEDEIALNTYKRLKEKHDDLKLLIAPRHPQRFNSVYDLIQKYGFANGRVSENANFDDADIILGDTMGELAKFFSFCSVAYIGGSFFGPGGHNPLEANIWNKPVVSGPNVANFKDIYKILTEKGAAVVAQDTEEFYQALDLWFSDITELEKASAFAGDVFAENRGAVQFLINRLN